MASIPVVRAVTTGSVPPVRLVLDPDDAIALPTAPQLLAGGYYFTAATGAAGTNNALVTGTLRVVPWIVQHDVTIIRLGAEVTTIGDVGSKLRLGIYADTGTGLPGALVVDAGQIAGDSATVQDLTIDVDLTPGIYWVGGAVQAVNTTQPTIRTVSNWTPPIPIRTGTSAPAAGGTFMGYTMTGVTGALPSTFTVASASGTMPRTHIRVAA